MGQLLHILPEWHGGRGIRHLVFTSRRGMLPSVRAVIDFLLADPARDARSTGSTSLRRDLSTGPVAAFHAVKPPVRCATLSRPISCAVLVDSAERQPLAQ